MPVFKENSCPSFLFQSDVFSDAAAATVSPPPAENAR
jgi:hypothetical protein